MIKEVIIKSNKYGINLILDDQIPFQELLKLVGDKFKESGSFFQDARMAISFEGRKLTPEEELAIVDTITENSSINIVSVIDNDPHLEELMRQRVEGAYVSTDYSADHAQTAFHTASASREITAQEPDIPQPAADFYKGNLRSGQTLECASSVTLIGDVNPGAKIISDGNIVVLGSMKGNAHAGASGDSSCFIFALDMRPIQLQIGDLIAKSPDKEKGSWRSKKKAREENSQYSSQIAVVRDGYICIEPMTKGCLDRL